MLNAWGVRQNNLFQCPPNSWEREWVGWITPDSIFQTTSNITLRDYVTTGDAIKIKVPGSNSQELFRLEYHTKASSFDNPEVWDATAKGLYIIHQTGIDSPLTKIRLIPADGRWTWTADEYVNRPYTGKNIPVLKKSAVDRVNGVDDSRAVSYTWTGGSHPFIENPFWIHVYRDRATNQMIDQTVFQGDGQDAFGLTKNNLFTPWSNPNSHNIAKDGTGLAIEVVSESGGTITLNVIYGESSALALAPSKPQDIVTSLNSVKQAVINWAANIETDFTGYNIYRQIYYGTTTVSEIKINSSLLTSTTFIDNIVIPAGIPNGVNLYVRYKIEAVDNQAKTSLRAPGNSILLGTTSSTSGPVSSNTTWSGVKFVTGSVTVNSSATLTIADNSFICFSAVTGLTVSGKINANNSSFQGTNGVTWNGVTVTGPATSVFTNCSIRDCITGLTIGGSAPASPLVNNCNISGYSMGIWIKDSGDPHIFNSYIKSTGTAVILSSNNALGWVASCKLYGTSTYGHKNDNSATTWYHNYSNARNIIDGTAFPFSGGTVPASIYVTGGYPYFDNGNNSIPPRSYLQQYNNSSGSSKSAIGNYWGGGAPVIVGTVTYSPYLSTAPNPVGPNWTLSKNSSGATGAAGEDSPLADAWKAFFEGDFNRSVLLSKNIFNEKTKSDKDGKISSEAMFLWMKSAMFNKSLKNEKTSLSSFSRNSGLHKSNNYEATRWMAKLAAQEGNFKQAEELALSVPNTSLYGREILLDVAVEILEKWSDIEKAKLLLDKLTKLYPDSSTLRESEFVLALYTDYISQMEAHPEKPDIGKVNNEIIPVAAELFEAYPNPFNPVTQIKYQIPNDGFVSLKIYDILGNEVADLVNGVKTAGVYEAEFNASSLASGVYIYRIQVRSAQGGFMASKKMILAK